MARSTVVAGYFAWMAERTRMRRALRALEEIGQPGEGAIPAGEVDAGQGIRINPAPVRAARAPLPGIRPRCP